MWWSMGLRSLILGEPSGFMDIPKPTKGTFHGNFLIHSMRNVICLGLFLEILMKSCFPMRN